MRPDSTRTQSAAFVASLAMVALVGFVLYKRAPLETGPLVLLEYVGLVAPLAVSASTAFLLLHIHYAGIPLRFVRSDRDHESRKHSGTLNRDDCWRYLAMALFMWSAVGILKLPLLGISSFGQFLPALIKAALVDPNPELSSPTDVTKTGVAIASAILSVLNNWFFLEALRRIDRTGGEQSQLVAWLDSRWPSVRIGFGVVAFCLVALLVFGGGGAHYGRAVAAMLQLITSAAVLFLYTVELSDALVGRKMSLLRLPWWAGLVLQGVVEVDSVLKELSPDWYIWNQAHPWMMPFIALTARSLLCLTLLGQALSWYFDLSHRVVKDLEALRDSLVAAQARVPNSPMAERLQQAIVIVDMALPQKNPQSMLPPAKPGDGQHG